MTSCFKTAPSFCFSVISALPEFVRKKNHQFRAIVYLFICFFSVGRFADCNPGPVFMVQSRQVSRVLNRWCTWLAYCLICSIWQHRLYRPNKLHLCLCLCLSVCLYVCLSLFLSLSFSLHRFLSPLFISRSFSIVSVVILTYLTIIKKIRKKRNMHVNKQKTLFHSSI